MDLVQAKRSEILSQKLQLIVDIHHHHYYGRYVAKKSITKYLSPELRHKLTTPPIKDLLPADLMNFALRAGGFQLHYALLSETVPDGVASIHGLTPFRSHIHNLTPAQCNTAICELFKQIMHLVERGGNIDARTASGASVLMIAAVFGIEMCRYFITKGADVRAVDNKGQTVLCYALATVDQSQMLPLLELLMSQGADPFRRDKNGEFPLLICSFRGDMQTLNFLTEKMYPNDTSKPSEMKSFHRLASHRQFMQYLIESDSPKNYVFQMSDLQWVKQRLDEAIQIASEIVGKRHQCFYDVLAESSWFYLAHGFLDEWIWQIRRNLNELLNQDLDNILKCSELDRLISDFRFAISKLGRINSTNTFPSGMIAFEFNSLYELLKFIVNEAVEGTHHPDVEKRLCHLTSLFPRLVLLVDFTHQEKSYIKFLISQFLQLELTTQTGRGLLIASIKEYVVSLMAWKSAIFLLECGSCIDDTDEEGSNVVHILVDTWKYDIPTMKMLARLFVDCGIHCDSNNNAGLCTLTCLATIGVDVDFSFSLLCLSARVIRKCKFQVQGLIPALLVDFVRMH